MRTHIIPTGRTSVRDINVLMVLSKMILLFSFIILFSPYMCFSQTFPPLDRWEGDTNHFTEHEQHIQLDAPSDASPSSIHKATNTSHDITWELSFSMHFDPSASNRIAFDLMSSNIPNQRTYRLRIGENGNEDTYELVYIEEQEENLLWRGPDGLYTQQQDTIHLRITFNSSGEWVISYQKNGEWHTDGKIEHAQIHKNQYFMIHCHYTSTRSDLFDFHNISMSGQPFRDTIPPEVQWNQAHDTLWLQFSEPVVTSDATILINDRHTSFKFVNEQLLCIPIAEYQNQELNIACLNIKDTAQNIMPDTLFSFFHQVLSRYDVLISEVMANPTPERFLPPYEYVELYNARSFPVTLKNWHLVISNDTIELPTIKLEKEGMTLLTDYPDAYHDSIHVSPLNLPTVSRNGTTIHLLDHHKNYVHDFEYKPVLSREDKHRGGWSQELKDLTQPCTGLDNIHYSSSHKGGTPGYFQAVSDIEADPPFLTIRPVNDSLYTLYCKHAIDTSNISIRPSGYQVVAISDDHRQVTFSIDRQSSYQGIDIETQLITCSGYEIDTLYHLERIDSPQTGDLLISEVLYDGFDRTSFIEICNQSSSTFDASSIRFGFSRDHHTPPSIYAGHEKAYLWIPGRCLVFTTTPESVPWHYDIKHSYQVLEADMPNLINSGGHLSVYNQKGELIDDAHYSGDDHSPFLDNTKGISLTRTAVNSDNPWQSTGAEHGHATPTWHPELPDDDQENSNEITIPYTTISPLGDQYNDQLVIHHQMTTADNLMTAALYSLSGSKVATIANNQLLNQSGSTTWDGIGDNGKIPAAGVYALIIKVIDSEGNSRTQKELIVIAGEL